MKAFFCVMKSLESLADWDISFKIKNPPGMERICEDVLGVDFSKIRYSFFLKNLYTYRLGLFCVLLLE